MKGKHLDTGDGGVTCQAEDDKSKGLQPHQNLASNLIAMASNLYRCSFCALILLRHPLRADQK